MENEETDLKIEVDDALFEVLVAFSEAAENVSAPWLIVGATARVLLLENVYGWPKGLATQDIDFGVQVGDWDHYSELCQYLEKSNMDKTNRSPTKRFKSKQNMVFDLVPYGGVADENKQVFWPPHGDEVMTVRGFDSAASDVVEVLVNEKLSVPVISPVGLCALKLFAWEERHTQHPGRDARDIAYLFNNIESLYSSDMLFEEHLEAIEAADHDVACAGHYQLGKDTKDILNDEDHDFLSDFISYEVEQKKDSSLYRDLNKYISNSLDDDTQKALNYFNAGISS